MSFLLSNFVELGNDELRKVNGGAGSCGGGSGEGAGSSSGSGGSSGGSGSGGYSGGGTSTAPSMTVSAGAGSCGGGSSGGSGGSGGGSSYSGGSSGSGNPGSGASGNPGTGGTASGNGGSSYNPGSGYSGGSGNCSGGYTPGYGSTPPATDSGNKKDTDGAGSDPTVNLASIGCSTNIQDGKRGLMDNKFDYSNELTMQKSKKDGEKDSEGNLIDDQMNGGYKFSQSGCKMTGVAKVLSEITGKKIDPKFVNDIIDEDKDGLLSTEEVKKGIEKILPENATVTSKRINNPTKEDLKKIASDTDSANYLLIQGEDVNGGYHWLQATDFYDGDDGNTYVNYSATSDNDNNRNRKYTVDSVPSGSTDIHHVSAAEVYSITFN